ncbi:hypothetical protein CVT25_007618 [Psilocybe cyanescens]|uniref:Uncharacterized protein n=1 Tax=Psilocybe cyanescens TaxID=93625 RepID=A0A409X1B3_PSICY|nr:hypothetical protein CVT25_007618 [Psilocybe cyanescens]
MELPVNCICFFLVYHHCIQHSFNETVVSWNLHKVCTAGNKSPLALYQINHEHAINQVYWTGDLGDDVEDVEEEGYGRDPEESSPPADELKVDPKAANYNKFPDTEHERNAGLFINDDEEIKQARGHLDGMDLEADDGNFGIDIYCIAVSRLATLME